MEKDALNIIATRHSTRKFKPDMVAESLLDQVIEAGRRAPSGKSKNQNHFLVIRDQAILAKLVELVQSEFAKMEITPENEANIGGAIKLSKKGNYVFKYNAPVLIVVANQENYGNNMADVSCALENMLLAANALDLGACWINQLRWLNDNPVLQAYLQELGLKEGERVYGSVSLGYPDTPDGMPNRNITSIKGNEVTYIG
ncbi:MAG: nitroreductase [Selenomonas sp.]|uniref:nitroreductase n=1 Tax=Selenomonas sp. AE3005 TaxID=1485543 RepID=UPI0025D77BDA|nr:nitroreductase [Selenomonas sp. AE3005]MBQ1615367.1 nitroreductase [Selenomonas sp.]MBQ1808255.1 nitroreductase [Selenomonas sp.]MBQ1919514.1 nitroreductase [Selenomonas sp.]MBQ5419494.1 nitroreductase [Selenomonas sp.]MBQ5502269.1 nitroreductase [Selenomonas sp.]